MLNKTQFVGFFFSAILLEDSLNEVIFVEIARMLNVSEENSDILL